MELAPEHALQHGRLLELEHDPRSACLLGGSCCSCEEERGRVGRAGGDRLGVRLVVDVLARPS